MISNEIDDDDEDDDAATHVIASKDVLGSAELAELAESDFAPPRRPAPPPVPNRIPSAKPPAVHMQPAWADDGEYDETLNYGEDHGQPIDDDDVPTRMPPQTAAKFHPQFSPLQPPVAPTAAVFRPAAPMQSPIYDPAQQNPYERTAVSADGGQPAEPGPDLATKLLLLLIVMLAAALAVVLVLIARR